MDNLEIIILAATAGRRSKSIGPKALFVLKHETILSRQLRIIGTKWPGAVVKIILGFKAEKVVKYLKGLKTANTVIPCLINDFETSCPSRSIIAYRDSNKNTLVINGDLVFNEKLFSFDFDDSGVISTKRYIDRSDVGISDVDGYVGYFDYEFQDKFGQIFYLTKRDMDDFCMIASQTKYKNLLNFEILNKLIDTNVPLKIYKPKFGKIYDVDRPNDVEKTGKIV